MPVLRTGTPGVEFPIQDWSTPEWKMRGGRYIPTFGPEPDRASRAEASWLMKLYHRAVDMIGSLDRNAYIVAVGRLEINPRTAAWIWTLNRVVGISAIGKYTRAESLGKSQDDLAGEFVTQMRKPSRKAGRGNRGRARRAA